MKHGNMVLGEYVSHAWSAVYLGGGWRLVDPTWGAGKTPKLVTMVE